MIIVFFLNFDLILLQLFITHSKIGTKDPNRAEIKLEEPTKMYHYCSICVVTNS